MSEHKCVGRVYSGHYIGSHTCNKTARYEHNGKWYCKTHHPPTVEEKRRAHAAKWGAKITALRAALAQPAPEPDTCTWHQDGDSDSGLYATSCGRYFNLTDGTPEDNKMSWCCYCGKMLVQELITEGTK